MYASFFGLQQAPFSIAPDPRYLYLSDRHREALAHLLYGIKGGGGFVLLTGEIGAGKTTVCRCVLEQIPAHCRVAYIFNPKLTVRDLLRAICDEFGIALKAQGGELAALKDFIDPLNAYLLRSHAAGEHNILIVDEAQNLSMHVLEQLRLLTNLETSERKLLQIILIGQPELRQMLAQPLLEPLAQRVIARFHLGALDTNETQQYVQHRLAVAGLTGPVPFSSNALQVVHQLSRGVPRRINLLCDRALLGAYSMGRKQVNQQIVERAAVEVFAEEPPESSRPPRKLRLGEAVKGKGRPRLSARSTSVATWVAGVLLGVAATATAMAWWNQRTPGVATPLADPAPAVPTTSTGPTAPTPSKVGTAQRSTPPIAAAPVAAPSAPALAANQAPMPPGPPPLSALLTSEEEGVRALGVLWGSALGGTDLCSVAQTQRLQCYRTSRMTVGGLRRLDRPAVLKLQLPGGGSGHALLTSVTSDTVVLQVGQRRWQLPSSALEAFWQGDYATLWRLPPGQTTRLTDAAEGPSAPWLDTQLTALQGKGRLAPEAKTLRAKVEAFQRSNGVEVSGEADTTTMLLFNRAVGVDEPRLVPSGT